jgi:phage tail sheath protein FI
MANYVTPGAYIERDDRNQGGISRLRTDVAAFVGICERGPARRAVAVESWRQFQGIFGGLIARGYLAYVVRAFFENGGRRCWIVRLESEAAATAHAELVSAAAAPIPVWDLRASSSGSWGNGLSVRCLELSRAVRRLSSATADGATLDLAAGLSRGTTVLLSQEQGGAVVSETRVLSSVASGNVSWNSADPHVRLASDAPLALLDPARPIRIASISYQLQVSLNGLPVAVYDDLAPSPAHPRYGPRVVNGAGALFAADPGRTALDGDATEAPTESIVVLGRRISTTTPPPLVRLVELRSVAAATVDRLATGLDPIVPAGGIDGLAALRVEDFIGASTLGDDSAGVLLENRRGLSALEEIGEVSIVAVPDIHIQPREVAYEPLAICVPNPCCPVPVLPAVPQPPPYADIPPVFSAAQIAQVVAALVSHCETRADRVALVDPPFAAATTPKLGLSAIREFRKQFDSTYAALYFPWLEVTDPLPGASAPTLPIPPSGHVAGQIAATDLRVGVHKAPANALLAMAQRPSFPLDDTAHGVLNDEDINCIRAVAGRGLRIAGARLVSSRTDLRFLNVRRLLLMIERALEASLQWAVFEGNDWLTRAKISLGIDGFLRELWSRGALMGAKASEAYFVRCDDGNNPPAQRADGELVIEVGVAASVPFEFVVLRIGRSADSLLVTESDTAGA